MPGFIPDGYTLDGFIDEQAPAHEAVTFTYRPATRAELTTWRHNRELCTPEEIIKRDSSLIASHLVTWDLRYPGGPLSGQLVPITQENCSRLASTLAARLIEIIALTDPGDARPGQPEPQLLDLQESTKN